MYTKYFKAAKARHVLEFIMGPVRSRLLRYFYEHQGRKVTALELQEQSKIDTSTIKGMLDILKWEGFVEQPLETCARITPKGIEELRRYH